MRLNTVFGLGMALLLGCGNEGASPTNSIVLPNIDYPAYDTATIALDLPVDGNDLAVLAGRSQLTERVNARFDHLTLNLFYVNLSFAAGCLGNVGSDNRLPTMAQTALADARSAGIDLESVVINVDLLTPSRLPSMGSNVPVLGLCTQQGGGFPTFGQPEHRRSLIEDFEALAQLPGLTRVTVGVDMNALYHAGDDDQYGYDFSNYVTSYREIYRAIKAVNPDVAVGPGLDFRRFLQNTVPYAAKKAFGLEACTFENCGSGDGYGSAVYEAYRLVVEPLVFEGLLDDVRGRADFVAWSVVPSSADAPFSGAPSFEAVDGSQDPVRRQAILDYFKPMLYVASWLPVPYHVIQADWTGSRGKLDKGVFLDVLLSSISSNLPKSVGWVRLTDLPRDEIAGGGSGNSICNQVVKPGRPEFERPETYCSGGLVDSNGTEGSYGSETVFDRLTQGRE